MIFKPRSRAFFIVALLWAAFSLAAAAVGVSSAAQEWAKFLGWTGSSIPSHLLLRVTGSQAQRYTFTITRDTNALDYSIQTFSGVPIFSVHASGDRLSYTSFVGKTRGALSSPQERQLVTEAMIFSNSIADAPDIAAPTYNDNVATFTVRPKGGLETIIKLDRETGECASVEVHIAPNRTFTYIPRAVSMLPNGKRIYSQWQRNNEPVILLHGFATQPVSTAP